jgi:hypothetical protein
MSSCRRQSLGLRLARCRRRSAGALIPVADGDFYTGIIEDEYSYGECFVVFYGADGSAVVTPTDGAITFTSSPIDGQYLAASSGGVIAATDVGTEYIPALFNSRVIRSKMTLSGIVGASFVRAMHWRHN